MVETPSRDLVRIERRGGTVLLTLDSPPVNVLSMPVVEALSARISEAEADPEARVVVIASAFEKAFAAGADVREMAALDRERVRVNGARGQALTRQIEHLPYRSSPQCAGLHWEGGASSVSHVTSSSQARMPSSASQRSTSGSCPGGAEPVVFRAGSALHVLDGG